MAEFKLTLDMFSDITFPEYVYWGDDKFCPLQVIPVSSMIVGNKSWKLGDKAFIDIDLFVRPTYGNYKNMVCGYSYKTKGITCLEPRV